MFIILGSDGVEYGPADAATIKSWIKDGRAVLQTKARSADSQEWKTLADFPEFSPAQQPPALPDSVKNDPIQIDAEAYAADLIARAKPLDITGCISRGWNFYKSDFGPILGVTLVGMLIIGAAGMVPFGSLIVTGPIMAGLYYYYFGKMRGQQRQLSDIFVGFSRMTSPLIVGSLVLCGIALGCLLPPYILLIAGAAAQSTSVLIGAGALFLVCLIVVMYISTVLTFMFPLIIDKNLGWKDAMKVSRRVIHSQFWRFFAMVLLVGLISCLGLLLLIIGVYLFIPLSLATYAYAYEDLCNPPGGK